MKVWSVLGTILLFFVIIFLCIPYLLGSYSVFSGPDSLMAIIFLFVIILMVALPAILSFIYSRKIEQKILGAGKGMLRGAIITIILNVLIGFYFVLKDSEGFWIMINFLFGIFNALYLITGFILYKIGSKPK